jgi:Matrixin
MPRSWRLCLVLTAVVALCAPGSACAYKFKGLKWPTHTIRYFSVATPSATYVARAIDAWNRSGANIHFVRTSSAAQAQLVIESINAHKVGGYEDLGVATVGWSPPNAPEPNPEGNAPVRGPHVWIVPPGQTPEQTPLALTQTVAHELGHVLGLGHETRGCATMNPIQNEFCRAPKPWMINCRVIELDDVSGVIALYGGQHRPLGPEFCDRAPAPGAPLQASATLSDPATRGVTLSWTNPGGITLGGSNLLSQIMGRPTVQRYRVYGRSQGVCAPRDSASAPIAANPTHAGVPVTTLVHVPAPGDWCFTIVISDIFDRAGLPAHATITVP